MSIIERLTSLFAPDDCLHCGREGSLLCRGCQSKLPPLLQICFGCQRPTVGAGCQQCLERAGITELKVASNYGGEAKLLVACLKFRGNQSAARIMADIMAPSLASKSAILVNLPATTSHIRQRGFDQAALVARHLSRQTGLTYFGVLRRLGRQHQLGSARAQRLRQLEAALYVSSPKVVRGKHVMLIDDVLTTGSSLTAAARVLKSAGAARVDACVFAQAVGDA